MALEFEYAMKIAQGIMSKRPQLVLCGSVSLICQKTIDRRDVNDLDFVTTTSEYKNALKSIQVQDYPAMETDKYTCYKVVSDNIKGKSFYYNVFTFDDQKDFTVITFKYQGRRILVQDAQEILQWKKLWKRGKDLKDLEYYNL